MPPATAKPPRLKPSRVKPPCARNAARRWRAACQHLAAQQRAAASVEFALNALTLIIFLFALINLGDLGLVLGTMKHAVQSAVRNAVVQTGANFASGGNTAACATSAQIIGYFNNVATPILPAATSTGSGGTPAIQSSWTNATLPGTSLTVTATYHWAPVGLPNDFAAIPLSISSTQIVIGTSGAVTTCS